MALDILGVDVGGYIPSFAFGTGITSIMMIIGAFVIFVAIGGGCIYWYYMSRLYNKKIIIFENISGQGYQNTGRDTARVIRVGDGGEEILFLRNRKIYRTAYGRKMGNNTYWFAIGQDGYWYNSVLGDLDAKMGVLDIEPIDRDMRYMHVAIRKNIQDRYQKKKMEKIVAWTIVGVVTVAVIIMIGSYFVTKNMTEASKLTAQNIEAVKPVTEALQNAVGHLDTLCSGGSGYVSAG